MKAWTRVAFALFVVGWGANEFTPLLLVYRAQNGLSATFVNAMFAAYVLGLIPALIASAALAGRFGHRAVLRPVMVLSAMASALLAAGENNSVTLFAGRVCYGVATGAAMAPGTTWVKELSADAPRGTGARRAAMSLSGGFCLGPVASGALAEWLPAPKVLPYLVHIGLTVLATALVWNAPMAARRGVEHVVADGEDEPTTRPPHATRSAHFWGRIAPMAPWVFTCPALAIVTVPALVAGRTASFAIVFSGLMSGVALGVGVLVQRPARDLEARRPGIVSLAGMIATVPGVALVIAVVAEPHPGLGVLAGLVLGCGYGLNLVGGLTRIEHAADPGHLAMTNAVFYSLTYLGFFLPMVIAALADVWSTTQVLTVVLLAALACLGVAMAARRAA